jgi:hypothetical protein
MAIYAITIFPLWIKKEYKKGLQLQRPSDAGQSYNWAHPAEQMEP